MNSRDAWNNFLNTGLISDYLNYVETKNKELSQIDTSN